MKKRIITSTESNLIFSLKNEGISQQNITNRLGVSQRCISYILSPFNSVDFTNKCIYQEEKRR